MYDKKSLSDEELWAQIKTDDDKAFDSLFEKYWSAVYTTAFFYFKDAEACKDLTHDIFLNLWQKRHILEIKLMKGYLTSAARYNVYKLAKKGRLSPVELIEAHYLNPENSCVNLGEEKLLYAEMEQGIEKALEKLPKRCKEIFILSRIDQLSNQEISEKLGISKRSVENQITSALKILRGTLKTLFFFFLFHKF